MKSLFLLFTFQLLWIALPAFAQDSSAGSKQTPALEKVSLQFQWKHQFEFAGFYAAKEKGFYATEGLDVDFYEIESGKNLLQSVLDGHRTYGISYSSLIVDYMQGKPVVFLANIFKHTALVLVAQKEFTKPSDLNGKKIMGSREELVNSGISLMFSRFNMGVNDFTIVPSTHTIEPFINKQVDAMAAFISNEPYLLDERNIQFNILNPKSYGSQFYDVNLFTSQQQWQNKPRQTRAFIRASIKGWKYALDHSDEIIDLILKKYNTQNKTRAALEYEARIMKSLILPGVYPLGSIDCKVVKQMASDFIHSGVVSIDKEIDFDALVYDHHCSDANSTLFTRQERHYLQSLKEIKVCVDPDWLPFEAIQNGRHVGMTDDFMRMFEQSLGIPITLVPTSQWTESLEYIKSHRCDILSLVMKTPDRQQYMDFTKAYLSLPVVIATTNDKLFISDLNNIKDKKIGIQKGDAYAELLAIKYPGIHLVEVSSVEEGLEQLSKGRLYAFIGDLNSIGYQIQKNYSGLVKVAGRLDYQRRLSVGVSKDEHELKAIFNKLIDNVDEKQRQNIINDWMSINVNEQIDYGIYYKSLGVITLVLLLLIYRYHIVSKYNKDLQRLNKQLELLSTTDPLTQLYNRRHIDKCIQDAYNFSQRYQTPFALILLDIDNFKRVNDKHGHSIGDSVLKDIAKILSTHTRKNDIVSRWGGEEFLIVCRQSDRDSAKKVAEKLRQLIASHQFKNDLAITSSFGVATYQSDDTTDSLINRADKALYQAKSSGKNQVVMG